MDKKLEGCLKLLFEMIKIHAKVIENLPRILAFHSRLSLERERFLRKKAT